MFARIKGFFSNQPKIQLYIINESGNLTVFKKRLVSNPIILKIGSEEHAYLVDKKHLCYVGKSKTPTAFFFRNNPAIINLEHQSADTEHPITPIPNASGFKTIMENKIIQDLFADEGDNKTLMILICAIGACVFSLLSLLHQAGFIKFN